MTALDVGRLLLAAGADPNIRLKRRPPYRDVPQDRNGDTILMQGATPLLRAARAGDAPFVELLLTHGALVDLPSKEGVTPLMAAAGVEFGTRVTRGRNRTPEQIEKDSDRDYYLSAPEAKEYGIVDHVVSSTREAQTVVQTADLALLGFFQDAGFTPSQRLSFVRSVGT